MSVIALSMLLKAVILTAVGLYRKPKKEEAPDAP